MANIPETIGPFHLLRPIARGGMAEVYEVKDPISGERYALKLLQETKTSIARFNREFEALTRLNHPSIVRVYRYGFHEDHPWITMELLEGVPLQTRVKRMGPPGTPDRMEEVVRLGYLIANALGYIHERGLVHRDLKSANVLVLADGRVKLFDFGTAHLLDPLERITREGDFVGTFSYAAPEQIIGSAVDHRSDLYAMGVLLYRLATGRRPFRSNDPRELARMHLQQEARPARELVPEVPAALEKLVQWMMEKVPADRPQSAEAVAQALEDIAGGPLTLPGMGIALRDGLSLGRDEEHRALWQHADMFRKAGSVLVQGGDATERARFVRQLVDDGGRRDWCVAVASADSGGLVGLARALEVLLGPRGDVEPGSRERVRQQLRQILALPKSAIGDALAGVVKAVADQVGDRDHPSMLVLSELPSWEPAALSALEAWAHVADDRTAGVPLIAFGPRFGDRRAYAVLDRFAPRQRRIELQPLDVPATALAVGRLLLRRPPPVPMARRIHRASGGNPTLIEAVVREMVSKGELSVKSADGNRVEWLGSAEAPRPDEVDARAAELLGELPALGRRVFEVMHVAGGALSATDLSAGMGWTVDECTVLLRDLVSDLWVTWDGSSTGVVYATDPWLPEIAGSAMTPRRRALVEELLVDRFELRPADAALVSMLLGVGRREDALARGVEAGRTLIGTLGPVDALEILEMVRDIAEEDEHLDPGLKADFLLLYARCVQRVRPMDASAVRALESALSLGEGVVAPARLEYGRAEFQEALGHYQNARRFLENAWEMVAGATKTPLAVELATRIASSDARRGELQGAMRWYRRAQGLVRGVDDLERDVEASIGALSVRVARGELKEAVSEYERLFERCAEENLTALRHHAMAGWARVLRAQGRFSEITDRLNRELPAARMGQDTASCVALLLALAWTEMDLYRLGRAQEHIDELNEMMNRGERLHLRLETGLVQGRVELASGQISAAAFRLDQVVKQAERAELTVHAERARSLLGEARFILGDRDAAMRLFQKSMISLMGIGHQLALAEACIGRARAISDRDDPAKAFKLVEGLLRRREFRVLRVEHALAEHRAARTTGDPALAKMTLREARIQINQLEGSLDETDRAALRVHPWTRQAKELAECV